MLTKTSDVISHAGVNSFEQLEEKLTEDIGNATVADLLNHSIGGIFSNPSKSIVVIASGDVSSVWKIQKEERRVIFNGNGHGRRVPIANLTYPIRLSRDPAFFHVHKNGGPFVFSKTLLGELVGDIFAVQGIYAGADSEWSDSIAHILRVSSRLNGLSTPLASLLLLEWANMERQNPSLRNFIEEFDLCGSDGYDSYKVTSNRFGKAAKWLNEKGFLLYSTRSPKDENIYTFGKTDPLPESLPSHVGKDAALSIYRALLEKEGSATEVAERVRYDLHYTQVIIYWLVENGYAEILKGRSNKETSAVWGTRKSKRLCDYVDDAMELLGFHMGKGRINIWERPKIDVKGLIQYRESLVDSICTDEQKRKAFEEACRVAYQRHVAQFGKNGTTTTYAQQI